MYTAKINNFLKKKKYPLYFFILAIFFSMYAFTVNRINSYNISIKKNFDFFLRSNEFKNIKEFVFENLNSPYKEYSYIVENNDTIEKILKKHNVTTDDINNIASAVVRKKLTNIFAGTEVKFVIKEESGNKKIVSLFYPINAITSVEIKRNKNNFIISENTSSFV